ncbi:Uma2 family endonuclease [Acaryochloris sp. CCMEE 5410]|uniref:Uma2 family endonuclease n=1 Tax=Acaryochloris sp. CCMEE 5410 TaxID=310037 RepID=UPI0002484F83|nr:Uma2 family endonuclease [Acaryochloris sp. CCMEE 5410]KAI9130545.1 Uma2 family endonuclease [Acaryochloris sp. CCMEE 5410]
MTQAATRKLTLDEFLTLPEGETACELIDGEAIPKIFPTRFHSKTCGALIMLLQQWAPGRGEVGIEWAVVLSRDGKPWVPVPDLLYISHERLSSMGDEDGPCLVPPELVIEVISPDQSFGGMAEKATDYLSAGILRVWIVDPKAKTITVFIPEQLPITYRENLVLSDELFPELELTAQDVFRGVITHG